MRIISKQFDYYDCMMRAAYDPSIVYVREPIEEKVYYNNEKKCPFKYHRIGIYNITKSYYIGFCGKVYPLFGCHHLNVYLYSMEEVKQYYGKISDYSKNMIHNFFNPSQSSFEKFFKHPIFVVRADWNYGQPGTPNRYSFVANIEYNALLKDYNFQKIFNARNAFQELQMYVSNIARPEKEIWKISDEEMAQAKGFNQFSFRKDKSKKR